MAGYVYNPFGIRVRSDTTTMINQGSPVAKKKAFVIDAHNGTGYAQVLEEKDGTGAVTMSYTIGDDVIAQSGPSVTHHFGYDGHGSTRILTDDTAAIESGTRYDYDAYGVTVRGQSSTLNPPSSSLLYTGEQFDVDLQQYYLRARYYDQSRGRFTQVDPFSGFNFDPASLHKYAYAHCDPENAIDPSGEWTLVELLAVAGLVANIFFAAYDAYKLNKARAEGNVAEIVAYSLALSVDLATIFLPGSGPFNFGTRAAVTTTGLLFIDGIEVAFRARNANAVAQWTGAFGSRVLVMHSKQTSGPSGGSSPSSSGSSPTIKTNWGPKHQSVEHNNLIEDILDEAFSKGAPINSIRKNKLQVDAAGSPVNNGTKRFPDASWVDANGKRHNVNFLSTTLNGKFRQDELSRELDAFEAIQKADPNAICELVVFVFGSK